MNSGIAVGGFLLAAAGYLGVAGILLLGWRGRAPGLAALIAVAASVAWGALLAWLHVSSGQVSVPALIAVDSVRLAGWYTVLLAILATMAPRRTCLVLLAVAGGVVAGALASAAGLSWGILAGRPWTGSLPAVVGIVGAVTALVFVEQVFRNASPQGRWSLKYLCLGLGTIFVYDLFLFADALLMRGSDTGLWAARGYVNALVAPLMALAAARNPDWSLDVYVSRRFALHTATLGAAGAYLVVMSAVGYSLRAYGGVWGEPLQAVFLAGGGLVLAVLLFSGQLRARMRVLFSKHLYNYRYDYREEWLRYSRTMTAAEGDAPLRERVIQSMAQVVESPGGQLWQPCGPALQPTASWNLPAPEGAAEPIDGPFARFLAETEWVVSVHEWQAHPARYRGVPVPEWLSGTTRAWLVVPLLHHDRLEGFVVLADSLAGVHSPNWEDCDLLKLLARQSATYLAQDEAADALRRAQQFETFSRLSAFVLHDLKNVIGQLSMLARNARRHGDRPEFMADAVETIEHAVERMNQLMTQLRGGLRSGPAEPVDLVAVLREVVAMRVDHPPRPTAELPTEPVYLEVERERLTAVLRNLVQNAQEATPADGEVRVVLQVGPGGAVIEIHDTGCGMSESFIRERLFRPFDTSKGTNGMGIGAFEAREFVRALGGEVQVESTPGAGTRFRVHWPESALVQGRAGIRQEQTA